MSALMRQIALVSESNLIQPGDLSKVAAAIQKQAARDLAPIWDINATVDAFAALEDVPVGYWSVIIKEDIDEQSAAGIHEDENGQPFALVTASSDINVWSVTTSHETLEMLVDPFGNRLVAADSKQQGKRVSYLVEVCDPSEASEHAYSCNGIFVSDFFTPNFFDPVTAGGVRYSFTGAISQPLQVLRGGYLSWQDAETNEWCQESWFDGDAPTIVGLGHIDQKANGNVRAVIDRKTMPKTLRALGAGRAHAKKAGLSPEQNQTASSAHAKNLRAWIGQILARPGAGGAPAHEAGAAEPVTADAPPRAVEEAINPAPAAAPPASFDPLAAVQYGLLVNAVYSMYTAAPNDPAPPTQSDFPTGYRMLAWVQMNDFTIFETSPQFYGVIAQGVTDPTKFVLALRGTENPIEWFDNFTSLIKVPFKVAGCGSVSYGFSRIYDTLEIVDATEPGGGVLTQAAGSLRAAGTFSKQMAALVRKHAPTLARTLEGLPRITSIDVTAHSLGSALATLYVLENAKEDKIANQTLYTFASPMVGDATFAAAFDALQLTSWRIVNQPDLVPKAPGEFLGYQHIGVEKRYDSTGIAQANPTCWHAMATYLALLDRTRQPDPACRIPPVTAATPGAAPVSALFGAALVQAPAMTAIDTNVNVTPYLPALVAAGVKAIGRYYTKYPSKLLTPAEAKAISGAGLEIFVVYEDGANPAAFNAALGTYHAKNALACAAAVGQPASTAIYFAVDFDCTANQYQQGILPYFQAINAEFVAQGSPYKIGVYGSGFVCTNLLNAGLCVYSWLTNSTGFQGYQQFYTSRRWSLAQHLPKYYGKLQADPNETAADFGAFRVGASTPPGTANLTAAAAPGRGIAASLPATAAGDGAAIGNLVAIASNAQSLQAAQAIAAQRLLAYDGEIYPQDGCAITLSVLLQQAGVKIADTYLAIDMCNLLLSRGWSKIPVGAHQTGDVGSTCGTVAHHGTDHVYVVLKNLNADEMVVADNPEPAPHFRYASGAGKSPTTYFMRAPNTGA